MKAFLLLLPLLFLSPALLRPAAALPLSTNGRWIVDETGHRVKLACVNWPGHVETMIPEGLNKQPVDSVAQRISDLGFNCVRLTYAIYMLTNETYANMTVRESLLRYGLHESVSAFSIYNSQFLDLALPDSYKAVVEALGSRNVMVVADNHVSRPTWCCGSEDGNGFFGDEDFDPDTWIKGLTMMATKLNESTNVIAFSLRNELRGPRQNVPDWFKYMERGAEAVHKANKNVLTILSGLNFDNDLSFVRSRPVNVSFTGKLAFEMHWYSFSNPGDWRNGNPNNVCPRMINNVMWKAGYLLDKGFPLFLSEFGADQRGVNMEDNRYITCVLSLLADLDLDWALWTLQGSYYFRQGNSGGDEAYSVLAYDWIGLRNETYTKSLASVQKPFRGPGFDEVSEYKVIYHPFTGKCLLREDLSKPVKLGSCSESEAWGFGSQMLKLNGSTVCVQAYGHKLPARLGTICGGQSSKWDKISNSQMQFASQLVAGKDKLCLDVASDMETLVTTPCKCPNGTPQCDPETQWFKLISSTRKVINPRAILEWLY